MTGVERGGPAERIGLEPGDVLIGIGRFQAQSLDEAGEILETIKSGQQVTFTILRITERGVFRVTAGMQAR